MLQGREQLRRVYIENFKEASVTIYKVGGIFMVKDDPFPFLNQSGSSLPFRVLPMILHEIPPKECIKAPIQVISYWCHVFWGRRSWVSTCVGTCLHALVPYTVETTWLQGHSGDWKTQLQWPSVNCVHLTCLISFPCISAQLQSSTASQRK